MRLSFAALGLAAALLTVPAAADASPLPSLVGPGPTAAARQPRPVAIAKPRITFRAVASQPNVWVASAKGARSLFALGMGMPRDFAWTFAREYLRLLRTPHPVEIRADGIYNAFDYDDPVPTVGWFATTIEGAPSPFSPERQLVRVAVRGPALTRAARPPLVISFIVATAGGTDEPRRFALVKQMMKMIVDGLLPDDLVRLTTDSPVLLKPTPVRERATLLAAIDALQTSHRRLRTVDYEARDQDMRSGLLPEPPSPGAGLSVWVNIATATQLHKDFFVVGVPVTAKNFDDYLAQAAQGGFDTYRIVGNLADAKRAVARELPELLELLGQNLRVEVAFDPKRVRSWRLIGFNHGDPVKAGDFADGRLVLGPFGAGFALSALYELELDGGDSGDALGTVTVRADDLDSAPPRQLVTPLLRAALRPTLAAASTDLRFAAAAAGAGDVFSGLPCPPAGPSVICSETPAVLGFSLPAALTLARGALAGKTDRQEFVRLVAAALAAQPNK